MQVQTCSFGEEETIGMSTKPFFGISYVSFYERMFTCFDTTITISFILVCTIDSPNVLFLSVPTLTSDRICTPCILGTTYYHKDSVCKKYALYHVLKVLFRI